MNFTYCDQLKELANNQVKMENELNIPELDKMIHDIFPNASFEMQYKVEEKTSCYKTQYFRFTAESTNDLTEQCGLFSKALKECKLETFNTNIWWDDKGGYLVNFGLILSYAHFGGGTNGMDIATFFFENGHWIKRFFKGEDR